MLATGAMAQGAVTPEKLALARQMMDASGGAQQMNALLSTMFKAMSANVDANLPAEQQRLRTVLLEKMQGRMSAVVPQMIDGSVQVYAKNLTEKELRDYVAWMKSDTAQSVNRKLPQITAETMQVLMPAIVQVTQGMKQDVIDEVCKQASCSTQDRQALTAAMDKAMPKQPG
jgi:hypothetical protein